MRRFKLLTLAVCSGIIGIALLLLTGCSVTKEPGAYGAVAADTATTYFGLSAGFVETNPLGWAVLPYSIAMIEHAKTLPPEEGVPIVQGVSAVKWGATLSNVLLFVASPFVAAVSGIGLGLYLWTEGEGEREFWAICAREKIECKFEPYTPEAK